MWDGQEGANHFENTSGQGRSAIIPQEIRKWNWGAFLISPIWGLGNNTWIALLSWVPYLNVIMHFVLGFKGNEWAWQNKRWDSIEHNRTAHALSKASLPWHYASAWEGGGPSCLQAPHL